MFCSVQELFVLEVSVQRMDPVFKGQDVFLSALTLHEYTVTLHCPEASVTNYQLALPKNPQKRIPKLHGKETLKSCYS
jgi:hypothetical protein